MTYHMPDQIKIAELDLSVFTGTNTQVVLTADESAHGYDYHVTSYIEGTDDILSSRRQTFNFYDQSTADIAIERLKKCVLDFLKSK